MKIVVLAGGLSTERAVSLVTGSSVCRALRENGHRAILVDLFLGLETLPSDPGGRGPDAIRRQDAVGWRGVRGPVSLAGLIRSI